MGIIPARYASKRFPGKPLVEINGKPMIQRVYERALDAGCLDDLIVATDDDRIARCVQSFGGRVSMTSPRHLSGTDRCAEVAENYFGDEIIINIQGDEPYLHAEQLLQLVELMQSEAKPPIATLAKLLPDAVDIQSEHIVKVVFNKNGNALYFSRLPVPFLRKNIDNFTPKYYKHIGLYAYRRSVLQALSLLAPSELERSESLEQLRWLDHGYDIQVGVTSLESVSVDVPEDIEKLGRFNF